jgi:hypothetical protein
MFSCEKFEVRKNRPVCLLLNQVRRQGNIRAALAAGLIVIPSAGLVVFVDFG